MLTMTLILLGVTLAIPLWWHAVKTVLALPREGLSRIEAVTADGWRLAMWHRRPAVRRFSEPVILCHGLANNHQLFEFHTPQNLAQYLTNLGFEVFSVDLRGSGESQGPHEGPFDATVDDFIDFDAPAIVQTALNISGATRVFWVGHSMGGMVGLGALPLTPGVVAGVCTIGTPIFFQHSRLQTFLLGSAKYFAPWGLVPAQWASELAAPFGAMFKPKAAALSVNLDNLTPHSIRRLMANIIGPVWSGVARQLLRFVRDNSFVSMKGLDYRERVKSLAFPMLVLGGTVDGLAPLETQQSLFGLLTTPDKTLRLFGKAHGQAHEYGHGDLVVGRNVETEVYPVLGEWLQKRATSLDSQNDTVPEPR